ncbi:Integral membrane protein [Streptococcus sp. DD10]|uniref:DUF975 family protein n=1 Tax=Streptococcus sp. DD10 TaxID=1777878 RepID=UPI0007963ADF|nr:DUF975 family protein [Streptococcus sp. DD10]KXT74743.1 Integral membrane protein [Streptococcus sp. DD10]
MNIRAIREKARQVKKETPGFVLLYLIPILTAILSNSYNVYERISLAYGNSTPGNPIEDFNYYSLGFNIFSGTIFVFVMQLLLQLVTTSANFTNLDVLHGEREAVNFKDSLRAFDGQIFGKVLATIFLKQFFLFLWSLLATVATIVFVIYSILGIIFSGYTGGIDEGVITIIVISFLLMIIGTIIAVPQYYAYTQVDYILYNHLKNDTYPSAFSIIRESRRIMKGYKFKRFILDLSFIGWYILVNISFGLVGIYVIPYKAIADAIFYEKLLTLIE